MPADTGRPLAGVIFDMDGVIVDSEPLSMSTITEMAAERGIQLEPALLHELTGVSLERVMEVIGARLGDGADPVALRRDYDARPGAAHRRAGGDRRADGPRLSFHTGRDRRRDRRPGPGRRPRGVASGEEVARSKPAPDVYRLAIRRLGAGPAGVVAIEDSATGVAAAVAAGLVCVAVRTAVTHGHDFGRAALIVSSLEELAVATLQRLVPERR
jgi:beta-phosphoglucomutase-like phosphatase (HAD superfamily)